MSESFDTEANLHPQPDMGMANVNGADIEMWNAGPTSPDRKCVRPCRIRINGQELVIADGSAPFVHVDDFGGRANVLTVDIKGIIVRSLKIHPTDPGKPSPNITVNNTAPPIGKEWYDRLSKGMNGARPKMPNPEYYGQFAGAGVAGLMETFGLDKGLDKGLPGLAEPLANVVNNITVVNKRPWWKFWGK